MVLKAALPLALVALSALTMACEIPESSEADTFDEVPYSTMAGEGTGSGNHLSSVDLYNHKINLFHAAENPLAVPNPANHRFYIASSSWNNSMLNTAGGREVLKYAVKCALPANQTVYYKKTMLHETVDMPLYGGGILDSTTGWRSNALGVPAIQDLMACVAAHLNAEGAYIDINLVGARVNDSLTTAEASEYTWDEAFWVAKVGYISSWFGTFPYVDLKAYPLHHSSDPNLAAACATMVVANGEAMTRSCNVDGNNCNVAAGNVDTDCFYRESSFSPQTGVYIEEGWYCKNTSTTHVRAIKTRLKQVDQALFYQNCEENPIDFPQLPGTDVIYEYY